MASVVTQGQTGDDAGFRPWLGVIVMAVAGFSMGSDLYMLPALLPSLSAELKIPLFAAGRMLTLYAAMSAVAAPILVVLFRAANRRTLLLGSVAALAATNVLVAVMPGSSWFAATRVMAALGGAILSPIRTATAGALAPPGKRARAIAIATIGQSAALVVGAPLGLAVTVGYGWRIAFAGAAGVSLVALLGILAFVPSLPSSARTTMGEQVAVLKSGKVVLTLLANAASLAGIFVLLTFLRPVLEHVTTFKVTAASAVFAVYGIAGTAGNAMAGWAADRMGSLRVMIGGLLLAGLSLSGISVLFLWPASAVSTAAVLLLVVLWGVGAWAFYAIQFNRLVELAPKAPAAAVSWASPATFAGVSLGATLGGITLQYASVAWLGGVAGACFFVAAAFILGTVPRAADTRPAAAAS